MVQRGFVSVLHIVLATLSVLLAQDSSVAGTREISTWERNVSQCFTPPYCSDAKRNDAGELINMDYFTAKDDGETTHLLHLVEIAHTNKVLPQISKNDYAGALSDIKYTLNRFPNHPRGLLLITLYGRITKSYAFVVPYYEKAIRLYPHHALTYAQYGAYMVTVGSVPSGVKKLEQSLEINPELVFAHVWLAAAYSKIGNMELSRKAESKARDLGYEGKLSIESLQNNQPSK